MPWLLWLGLGLAWATSAAASAASRCLVSEEYHEGASCDYVAKWPRGDCDEPSVFYWCSERGLLSRSLCGLGGRFSASESRCVEEVRLRVKRQGLARIGEVCQQNVDCDGGLRLYCVNGRCACSPGFVQSVQSSTICIQQINPGQTGCTEPVQCVSVWFGTTCTGGTCTCPTNEYATQTRDGFVCIRDGGNAATASCPLPVGDSPDGTPQGLASLLYPIGATTVQTCTQNTGCQITGQPGIQDMYDCVARRGNAGFHCCPNRALTCIMPQVTGTGGGNFQRWWYNAASDTCQSFTYQGRAAAGTPPQGNSNNFPSQAQCESFCRNRCQRGQPAYNTGTAFAINAIVQTCNANTGCPSGTNYQCVEIGTSNFRCCSTAAYVCEQNGGLSQIPQTPATGFDGDGSATAVTTVTRYYYSVGTRQCLPFTWSQYGGSFNNFATIQECQDFCVNVCPNGGEPLRQNGLPNAPYQACPCPTSSYTCVSNLCCPSATSICTQSLQLGRICGTTPVTRYYYNTQTRTCDSFTFGGCPGSGNDNNFETQNKCITACANVVSGPTCPQGQAYKIGTQFQTCSGGTGCPGNYECLNGGCCPTKAYTCSLNSDAGSVCGAQSTRYFYDGTQGTCNAFTYSGCDGNSNNFGTITDCQDYCGSGGCPSGGTPQGAATGIGFLTCGNGLNTCSSNFECVTITLPNGQSQQAVCCPTRASICQQPLYQGDSVCGTVGLNNNIGQNRWYFDPASRACRQFQYNGCGGNQNNFPTSSECNNFCASAACPVGQGILGNGATASTCSPGNSGSCPSGYSCLFDSLFSRNVCCGAQSLGCTQQEIAFVDYRTNDVQTCQPSQGFSACPNSDYNCKLDTRGNRYICCKPNNYCPGGFLPQLSAVFISISATSSNSVPVRCYINGFATGGFVAGVVTSCNSGFTCQQTVPGSPTGYCCSSSAVCPAGQQLQPPSGGQYTTCVVNGNGFNACGSGYSCQSASTSGFLGATGYCCGLGAGNNLCGTTGSVVTGIGGAPQTCSAPNSFNPSGGCPNGATCTPSTGGVYYCCTGVSGICPGGTVQLASGNVPQLCRGVGDSGGFCNAGYTCTENPASRTFYCCSAGAGTDACASGQAQLQNGVPVSCNPSRGGFNSQCTAGYSCTGSGSSGVCCTTFGNSFCKSPYRPWLPGGSPVRCNGRDNRCPRGKVCQDFATGLIATTVLGVNQGYCCELDANVQLCPGGRSVAQLSGTARICSAQSPCSAQFDCVFSQAAGTSVCCAQVASGACPTGLILQSTTCSPQRPTQRCGAGGACVLNQSSRRYQCCSVSGNGGGVSQICPSGGTSVGTTCNAGVICPNGQTCELVNGINTCCVGGTLIATSCPQGGTLLLDRSCRSADSPACGLGNSCQLIANLQGITRWRCCNGLNGGGGTGGTGATAGSACPGGGVIASPRRFCSPGPPDTCGASLRCTQILADTLRRYMCCTGVNGGGNGGTAACQNGGLGSNQPCSPSSTAGQVGFCGAGRVCSFVAGRGRYECCTGGTGGVVTAAPVTSSCEGRGNANRFKFAGNVDLACPFPPVAGPRCPASYTCVQVADVGGGQGVCCRTGRRSARKLLASDDPAPPAKTKASKAKTAMTKKESEQRRKRPSSQLLRRRCSKTADCRPGREACNLFKHRCQCQAPFALAANGTECTRS